MEWYVLNCDFNSNKIVSYNIFNNRKFVDGVAELLAEFVTMDDFTQKLDHLAMYCFWSKVEYEVMVGDPFGKESRKIDVHTQIGLNLNTLAKYIVDKHNEKI